MSITAIFTPDHVRYEGVRPINVHLLRLFYFLMAAFVGTDAWTSLVTHQGPWDHVRAVAYCTWAAYPTLGILGLIHPLKMLPLMLFMITYKSLWLLFVAYPLWRANALVGSPGEGMARVFIWVVVPTLVVPWGYVFRNYVMWSKKRAPTDGGVPAPAPGLRSAG